MNLKIMFMRLFLLSKHTCVGDGVGGMDGSRSSEAVSGNCKLSLAIAISLTGKIAKSQFEVL